MQILTSLVTSLLQWTTENDFLEGGGRFIRFCVLHCLLQRHTCKHAHISIYYQVFVCCFFTWAGLFLSQVSLLYVFLVYFVNVVVTIGAVDCPERLVSKVIRHFKLCSLVCFDKTWFLRFHVQTQTCELEESLLLKVLVDIQQRQVSHGCFKVLEFCSLFQGPKCPRK